jgi:hypothetical protein
MEINKNLNRNNLNDTIIKSVIFKTIIEIFLREKKIDIKEYLTSIKEIWNVFLVKVTKPIIASELYLLNEDIKEELVLKLKKMWFNFVDFDLKYK